MRGMGLSDVTLRSRKGLQGDFPVVLYSIVSLALKHQCDTKKGCEQTNVLANMSLSSTAVSTQICPSVLPGRTPRDAHTQTRAPELLNVSDSSKGPPAHREQQGPLPHTTHRHCCLVLQVWGHLLWMGTGTCGQGQKVVFHQTLHFLTVQLDQAVVES